MKKLFKKLFASHKKTACFFVIVFFAALISVPIITQATYLLHVMILCMLYGSLVSCWNLIAGYMGVFTFGFQALFGFGGYASSLLCIKLGFSPWVSIFVGAFMAMLLGSIVAIPSLKLRQMPYICISTMCLGEVVRLVVSNLTDLTRGELGLWGMPEFPSIGPIVFEGGNRVAYYYLMLIIFACIFAVCVKIIKSPIGMSMHAIKDSQDAADSLGVNVTSTKVKIYMTAAFMAGIVGGFYAHYTLILTPSAVLGTDFMTQLIAMGLIGGLGTVVGPILGAFTLTFAMEFLRLIGDYRLIVYGALIIITVIFMRAGIWGSLKPRIVKKWDKWFGGNA